MTMLREDCNSKEKLRKEGLAIGGSWLKETRRTCDAEVENLQWKAYNSGIEKLVVGDGSRSRRTYDALAASLLKWRLKAEKSTRFPCGDGRLRQRLPVCYRRSAWSGFGLELGRKAEKRATVIPDPDYRIPIVLLGIAGGFLYQDNLLPAATIGLLGLLLLFQTTRVRFVFDEEALEVRIGEQLQESGENVFVGGKNRWKYSTFVNWELWWPNFPILVYFKETQTKPEGQIHFFPVIFNGKQLYDVMLERAGPSKTSMPK